MTSNLNLSKSNIDRDAPSLSEMNTGFFSVSPNPTSGTFTLSNSKFIAGNTYPLDVYNAAGARVLQMTLNSQQQSVTLGAAPGAYFVNLNTQDGLAVRKITLQGASS